MGKLFKLISKASDIATAVGEEYLKAKENANYQMAQQTQQQQQAYYAQQYGTYQQAGSSQREQPGSPQQYQQYPPPSQHQQYPPRPQEQQYAPPPSQQQQYPPPPQAQQYPPPPQQTQSQVDSDREAAEKLAAEYQAEYNREIAEAERELERLKKEQEEKLKEAERQLEGLRIQSESRSANSVNTPSSAPPSQQQYQQQYQQPQPSPAPSSYGGQQCQAPSPAQPQPQYQTQQQWNPQTAPTLNPIHPPEMHPCGIVPISICADALMDMELDWFIHPSAPEFLICSRCYVDHIYNTQFQSSFRMVHLGAGQQRKCLFSTKRMKDTLWPEAVSSSSLSKAVEFMQKRQRIPHCTDAEIRPGASWYTSPSIPHATFCAACYEDILMTSSFASNFTLSTALEAFCDASTFYVRRMFNLYAPSNNWSAFCQQVQARIQIPKCEKGLPTPTHEHSWYETTRGPRGTVLCGACYCDNFHNTPDQQYWRQIAPRGKETMCLCGNINMYSVSIKAFDTKDLSIFWRALDEYSKHPFCSPYETSGAKWFTLPNKSKEIIICGACYSTMATVWGGANWFIPKSSSFFKSDKRVCGFNVGHPRFHKNLNAFNECTLRGTWKAMGDLAALFASVEPCPRSKPNGYPRRYWGWQNAQICEECYVTFAKDTSFESRCTIRGVRSTDGICDLYSSRMRNLYSDACQSGDLQSFLNQAAQRKQIFTQMNQTLEMLKSAYAQENMQQKQMLMQRERIMNQDQASRMAMLNKSYNDGLIANMTKFRGDIQGCNGYVVGNSQMGWYKNETSLQGVLDLQAADRLREQALAPGLTLGLGSSSQTLGFSPQTQMLQAEAERIEGLWSQVE
ncbi:hypothetical protein CEP52_011580 [Fusarium oligoseptatum]|uniref:Integral membrane protein n=1 Tax=Fusarium oligoseptatum TaxID=2604345 RepID=A0A428T2F5_9HYPO|nr:hypothetical protein CEP52_011580 [Fusarium oligoseptatum]